MNPYQNPFSPGPGSPPPELVGRDALQQKAKIALHRLASGRPAKSMILVGQGRQDRRRQDSESWFPATQKVTA
jgi:hypothetical protein